MSRNCRRLPRLPSQHRRIDDREVAPQSCRLRASWYSGLQVRFLVEDLIQKLLSVESVIRIRTTKAVFFRKDIDGTSRRHNCHAHSAIVSSWLTFPAKFPANL